MPATKNIDLKNVQLKNWIVGDKLGEGACAAVYEAKCATELKKHDKGKEFAIKIAKLPLKGSRGFKQQMRIVDTLYAEYLFYRKHSFENDGMPDIPDNAYGEDKGYRFLVIECLGRSLKDAFLQDGKFSEIKAAQIGIDILKIIQKLHSKNVLYVDIKPDNFMFGKTNNKIYCADFGITNSYLTMKGEHKEEAKGAIIGTPNFLSLNCHQGSNGSRRDDIESILYVLIYLMKGSLPWENAKSNDEGAEIKKNTSLQDLCEGLSEVWSSMFTCIRNCAFQQRPDYEYIMNELQSMNCSGN